MVPSRENPYSDYELLHYDYSVSFSGSIFA
jgi:hypothetical protein